LIEKIIFDYLDWKRWSFSIKGRLFVIRCRMCQISVTKCFLASSFGARNTKNKGHKVSSRFCFSKKQEQRPKAQAEKRVINRDANQSIINIGGLALTYRDASWRLSQRSIHLISSISEQNCIQDKRKEIALSESHLFALCLWISYFFFFIFSPTF